METRYERIKWFYMEHGLDQSSIASLLAFASMKHCNLLMTWGGDVLYCPDVCSFSTEESGVEIINIRDGVVVRRKNLKCVRVARRTRIKFG